MIAACAAFGAKAPNGAGEGSLSGVNRLSLKTLKSRMHSRLLSGTPKVPARLFALVYCLRTPGADTLGLQAPSPIRPKARENPRAETARRCRRPLDHAGGWRY